MSDMNTFFLQGNLVKDPIQKSTSSGKMLCEFSIANNRRWGSEDKASFFNCIAWGKQAELITKYFHKGKPILVSGEISQEKWEKDGKAHSKVVFVVREFSFQKEGKKDNLDTSIQF